MMQKAVTRIAFVRGGGGGGSYEDRPTFSERLKMVHLSLHQSGGVFPELGSPRAISDTCFHIMLIFHLQESIAINPSFKEFQFEFIIIKILFTLMLLTLERSSMSSQIESGGGWFLK